MVRSRPGPPRTAAAGTARRARRRPGTRLAALTEHDPEALDALELVIVAAYYTDAGVRERLGYQGQVAKAVNALDYPTYLEEGLLDRVIERGPTWRDPGTRVESS